MIFQFRYIAVPFILITVCYVLYVTSGIPLADEWRWLKHLLIPLTLGEISFFDYLNGEYAFLSHSHYLTLLFLYFDYTFLHLDLSYFSYVGLFFYIVGFLVLTLYLKANLNAYTSVNASAYLAIAIAYFCLACDFPWLLVTFEYTYYFLAILFMLAVNAHVFGGFSRAGLLLSLVVCLLLGETIGMIAVFTSSFVLALLSIFERHLRLTAFLAFSTVVVTLVLQYMLLGGGGAVGQHSRAETLLAIINNPLDVVSSFVSIFCQPLLDIRLLNFLSGNELAPNVQLAIGSVGLIFVVVSFYIWFRQAGYKKSIVPLLFTGFGLLSWALIYSSRYLDVGVWVLNEIRYVRFLTLIYLGCWIALMQINHTVTSRWFLYVATVLLLSCFVLNFGYKVKFVGSVKNYFNEAKAEIMRSPINPDELGKLVFGCRNNYCDSTIDFLRKNNLSVFKQENQSQRAAVK